MGNNGSVNSKRAHPPPAPPSICHFVLEIMQMSHRGAGRSYENPTIPGKTPKLYFQVNKLKIPYLWEISNNLIKTSGAPYANRPYSYNQYCKNDNIHLININDRTIN